MSWNGALLALAMLLGTLLVYVSIPYMQDAAQPNGQHAVYKTPSHTPLDMYLDMHIVDVVPFSTKLATHIMRLGSLANLTLAIGSSAPLLLPAHMMEVEQECTLWTYGDTNHYPFDVYKLELAIHAPPHTHFGCTVSTLIQNWHMDMHFIQDHNEQVWLKVTAQRTPFIKGFSIFVLVLMWSLTLVLIGATWHTITTRREVTPPLIAVYVVSLFALPALRNCQPYIPPVGIMSDMAALVWNMMLVTTCAIRMILAWIQQYHPKQQQQQV